MKKKDLKYNYAKDQDFADELLVNMLSFFQFVQAEREFRETVWQTSYRAWTSDNTESDRNYVGRANIQLPQIRKEVETMSRRIFKALFPEDYLKAEPNRLEDEELSVANTQVVRHYLDNVMNMKSFAMPWIKQGVLYGSSPARSFWREDVNEQFLKERYFVSNKEGILEPKTRIVQKDVKLYSGPELRAEDVYEMWVYPSNADKPENIEMTFNRSHATKWDLVAKQDKGAAHLAEGWEDLGKEIDWAYEETQERKQQFGETGLHKVLGGQKNKIFQVLEVWCKILLPGESKPVACVVEILNNSRVIRVQRNPYWHQQSPFDWFRFILPPPGEFYGRGLPEASVSLQHMQNDLLNQTMDAATLALNNITVINPAYAPNAESFEMEPGAVWWADPNAIKQFTFPDYSNTGIKNVGMLRGFITELSDNSPQLPDPIAGKARSTGQAQLAVNEWQTDLFTIVDLISEEAMSSIAKKIHIMLQQNLTDDDVIKISGKYAGQWINRIVDPSDIIGNYNFKWKGALQIENQSIKTQQMLNFIKVYSQLPEDAGVKMNWENFMIKLLRDGFLIKDVENIIETSRLNASTPPVIEEKIMNLNGSVKVQDTDDDEVHINSHLIWLKREKRTEYMNAKMNEHINHHKEQQEKKREMIRIMEQQMQMQQQQAAGPGQGQGGGNPTSMPEATSQDNLERGMNAEQ